MPLPRRRGHPWLTPSHRGAWVARGLSSAARGEAPDAAGMRELAALREAYEELREVYEAARRMVERGYLAYEAPSQA